MNQKYKKDDNKDSKDKPRVKSEEYFIKVQYPNKADFPNGTHITITAPDKKNFKESKEYYHKVKE